MGMTDKQFNAFIKFIINALKKIKTDDPEMQVIIDLLQSSLED